MRFLAMKLKEIKQEVYKITNISTTNMFKEKLSKFHKGRDLRRKQNWAKILNELIESFDFRTLDFDNSSISSASIENINKWLDDIIKTDIEQEEKHRRMYYSMGVLLGWSTEECDIRWTRIQLKAKWDSDSDLVNEIF